MLLSQVPLFIPHKIRRTMGLHLRIHHRFVLSHGIVLVIFFQLGCFWSYQNENSWCECSQRQENDHRREDDGARRGQNRTLPQTGADPFAVSRVSAESLKPFWKDRGKSATSSAADDKTEAFVVRYDGRRASSLTAMIAETQSTTALEEFLQTCASLKVWEENLSPEEACLLVVPSEESYQVYFWELEAQDTVHYSGHLLYRPAPRIASLREDDSTSDAAHGPPIRSFYWTQQFISIQEQVGRELGQLLSSQPPQSTPMQAKLLLLVVNKKIVSKEMPRILASICTEDRPKILLWCVDAESHEMVQKQYSFLSSYYNRAWQGAAQERLPTLAHLVAELLAVQQLVLLGYHVLVKRHIFVGDETVNGQLSSSASSSSARTTMDWRAITADFAAISSSSSTRTDRRSVFEAPMFLVQSNVRTKALWAKLLLSLDLLAAEGVHCLDEIVSNYASLFGMQVVVTTLEGVTADQTVQECA